LSSIEGPVHKRRFGTDQERRDAVKYSLAATTRSSNDDDHRNGTGGDDVGRERVMGKADGIEGGRDIQGNTSVRFPARLSHRSPKAGRWGKHRRKLELIHLVDVEVQGQSGRENVESLE